MDHVVGWNSQEARRNLRRAFGVIAHPIGDAPAPLVELDILGDPSSSFSAPIWKAGKLFGRDDTKPQFLALRIDEEMNEELADDEQLASAKAKDCCQILDAAHAGPFPPFAEPIGERCPQGRVLDERAKRWPVTDHAILEGGRHRGGLR